MTGPESGGEDPENDNRWADEVPTGVTVRSIPTADPPRAPMPSLVDDSDRVPGGETTLNPPPSIPSVLAGAALPEALRASLEVLDRGEGAPVYELTTTRTVIGRGERADLRLPDSKLSRKHVSILYSGSEFRIRDEGSANGTLLNGSRVVEYGLRDGDILSLGDSRLRFRLSAR
jgi:hypothetical protein